MNDTTEVKRTIPEMLCRGFWMLLGPLILVPVFVKIVEHGNGWFTSYDWVFLGTLVLLYLARQFEFYKGHPRTAEGTPASAGHLRRYGIGVVAIGLPIWVLANVLGNYVFQNAA